MTPKEKANAYARENRKQFPDKWKSADLKKKFGIDINCYNKLLKDQNEVCAICGNPETIVDNRTKKTRSLAVDHCHTTKKVRGLLCMGCNQGLGNFRENPEFLAAAITYVLKHKS